MLAFALLVSFETAGAANGLTLQQINRYYNMKQRYAGPVKRPPRQALLAQIGKGETPLATATRLYGDTGPGIVARLRSFGPGFDRLVYHPGLVARLGQFKRFLNERHLRDAEPDHALAEFRKHLGTVTMYRALALKPGGDWILAKRGLESRLSRYNADLDLLETPPDMVRSGSAGPSGFGGPQVTFAKLIASRLTGWGSLDEPLVSITAHPEIALAVTKPMVGEREQLHLFTLQVPLLDTFHLGGKKTLFPWKAQDWLDVHHPDGTTARYPFASQAVESFMLLRVDPREIVGHETVPVSDAPSYEISARRTTATKRPPRAPATP